MVRYNIAALTNSHVTIKGGGAGQTIWAVNNTGGNIVQGDKVWINTDLTEQLNSKNIFRNSNGNNPTGFIKNNIYYGPTSMFIWNGSDYDTVNFTSSYLMFEVTKPYRIENNIVIQMGRNALIDESNQAVVVSYGQTSYRTAILNEKYVCSESTSNNLGIREYNIKNGSLVSSDIIYNFDYRYFQYPICFFNKKKLVLSRHSNAKGLRIFDDFTVATPTFTDYPTANSFYCVWFTNEDNIGSYAIGVETDVTNNTEQFVNINRKAWTIYKFNADGTLTFPDDLPTSLTTWLHVGNVCFTYNTQEGILCAIKSSQNRYGAWRLVNGKFVDIPLPEYINPEGGTIEDSNSQAFYISSDLKTLAINTSHKFTYTYQRTDVYRYNTIDGKWYATSPAWRDNNTLTGVATGETNFEGLYEIAVALPGKVSLTFNITPDEDSIEFKGVVA